MIKVFIGYDKKEAVAFHTLIHSILQHSTVPVSIVPLALNNLKGIYNRPLNEKRSTDFTFSRFFIPFLCNYEGWAIFIDSDMLFQADINDLWSLRNDDFSVQVVKHDYTPKVKTKFLNNEQLVYPKKNWSSVILFNCSKCKALSLEYLQNASGLELHQFKWLEEEDQIGELPIEWNYLVGEYPFIKNVKNLHFTLGGPYFEDYLKSDYSEHWYKEFFQSIYCENSAIKKMIKSKYIEKIKKII